MKAKVNQDNCIGCGVCEQLCPTIFRINENGVSEVYAKITQEDESNVETASTSCPVSVIEIEK